MDHEELARRFSRTDDELTPEELAKRKEVRQHIEDKRARGEVLTSWSKDKFPIGLDDNFEPFPVRERSGEDSAGESGGEHRSDESAD